MHSLYISPRDLHRIKQLLFYNKLKQYKMHFITSNKHIKDLGTNAFLTCCRYSMFNRNAQNEKIYCIKQNGIHKDTASFVDK